jgi:hypothetical protein
MTNNGQFYFLHIAFSDVPATKKLRENLEATFNKARDWVLYAPNCWIIYTKQSSAVWQKRIESTPGLPDDASFLIAPIDLSIERVEGRAQEFVWEWIAKIRP